MAKSLTQWRKAKGMKTGQLASKSGVPFKLLVAYERGDERIRADHLRRLADALYVDITDILPQSPPAKKSSGPKPQAKPVQEKKSATAPAAAAGPAMARPTQLAHLLILASKQGQGEQSVVEEIGKPLDELTQKEVRTWLTHYTESLQAFKERRSGEDDTNRPPDTRRRRAHLPEGVDEFELKYLAARLAAEDIVQFTLFDGRQFSGRIIGFSPYTIVIQQEDGTDVTLPKLALAYYMTTAPVADPTEEAA